MHNLYKCFHWLEEYSGKHVTANNDIIIIIMIYIIIPRIVREAVRTSGSCEYCWKEHVHREAGSSCGSIGMFSKADI